MGVNLFELLVILSAAILILSFVKCFINRDNNHILKLIRVANLEIPSGFALRIEVYYEALDTNSETFITQQLIPTYDKIKNATNMILVPYGKTQMYRNSNGTYEVRCKLGPSQCEANLQHACIVDKVQNKTLKLLLIGCLLSYQGSTTLSETFLKCSQEHQLPQSDTIQLCVKSDHGMKLLQRNGELTIAASKRRMQIPFIKLNESVEFEANRSGNLYNDICELVNRDGKWNEICG